MAGYEKFEAIIVDPDIDSRMRLKQATTAVHNFGKVYQLNTPKEALEKLCSGERADVIFVSHRFDEGMVKDFIAEGKKSQGGQDAAYILVLKAKDQGGSVVAQSMLMGVDGMLFEPYSVDQLVEITQLASRVRKERSDARAEAAIKILVNEMMNHLDAVAGNLAKDLEAGRSVKSLKDAAATIPTDPEQFKKYLDIGGEMFINAPTPKTIFGRTRYAGPSKRIKDRAAKKAAAKAGSADQAATTTPTPEAPKPA